MQTTFTTRLNRELVGGGPVYAPSAAYQTSVGTGASTIQQIDVNVQKHRQNFKKQLRRNWDETLRVTQPYRFDPQLNQKASAANLPESRNFGYRIDSRIVRDQLLQEAQDLKLREAYQTSVFSKAKRSPRGIKKQGVSLERTAEGGYRNTLATEMPDHTQLNKLLLKQNLEDRYHV